MVEGHSVHRICHALRRTCAGKRFVATSPNGRFADGARAIDRREFKKVEAIGKNLFAFFDGDGGRDSVVHVHFGMSGRWAIHDTAAAGTVVPEVKPTTRLVLSSPEDDLVLHLSAMTVALGDADFYAAKRVELGEDALREDADPEVLWANVRKSRKTIGLLLMDQACFAGVGNIYRAEILNVARVHPDVKGADLTRAQFDVVWAATVTLLKKGFEGGSIITTDPVEIARLGLDPELRRYIYNRSQCGRCTGKVESWQVAGRTCYACPACQPKPLTPANKAAVTHDHVFPSHCAADSAEERMATPKKMTVAELKRALGAQGESTKGLKADLVARFEAAEGVVAPAASSSSSAAGASYPAPGVKGLSPVSASEAAAEKVRAGEKRNVEHVADYAAAPAKKRKARRALL